MVFVEVLGRESALVSPRSFASSLRRLRAAELRLSDRKEVESSHRGAVNSLQVDLTEGRYLLSGASDGSTAIYDIKHHTDYAHGFIAKHKAVTIIDKQHNHGHKFSISTAIWYPVDTGLFVTGSLDHFVKVWDTNSSQVVMDFKMPGKVYATAMSSIATTHMLIAVGSGDAHVRLCDISSGAFTHTLSGHRDGVMTLEWSPSNEWVLVSGGCDGAIRFWDIRRAGCFLVLDQSRSQLGKRPPLLQNISTTCESASLRSTSIKNSRAQGSEYPTSGKKRSFSSRRIQSSANLHVLKRSHPGMSSSLNHATAHYGAVTGLATTGDGMYLLSSGSDSRMRLWDIESGCNTLVNFQDIQLESIKPRQFSVASDSSLVYVPCEKSIKVYDLWSGMMIQTLRGHYELVNSCFFNVQDQELYSGSNDRRILVWSPSMLAITELEENGEGRHAVLDEDNWSD